MAHGVYGGTNEPWTYTEGRVCKADGCDTPLPDSIGRFGVFSDLCPPCRETWRASYERRKGEPDGHRNRNRKRPLSRTEMTVAQQRTADRSGISPPTKADRTRRADAWKAAVIEGVSQGRAKVAVLRELGVSEAAHNRQFQRDATYAANYRAARLAGRTYDPEKYTAKHFGEFAQRYFNRTHFAHQLLLADTIDTLGPLEVVLVLMPPESGKTATLEDYMCRHIAVHPEHRFRVVSEAQDLARRIVGACKRRFTDTEQYPQFIARYGPFYEKGQERQANKVWTADQLSVWKNPGTERDYNLVAQSWAGANYGSRIDTLILDDLVSQRNVGESKKIFERIRGTFFNRGKQMRTIIVGTRIEVGDFYDLMMEAGLVTRTIVVPAMGGLGAQPGQPSTPGMWENLIAHDGGACCPPGLNRECPRNGEMLTAKEYLDLTRFRAGEKTWFASYMQNPSDDSVSTFGGAIDSCKDSSRVAGAFSGDGMMVCSIDPALGGGTALVAAEHSQRALTIVDARTRSGLARTEEQLALIEEFATRYRPALMIVEYDAQQKGLGNDERLRQMGGRLGFTIVPHITRGQKFDVPYAVASMNQSFVRREISIPWGDNETHDRMADLVHQLRGWRIPEQGKRDRQVQDLVMALWFQWRHWMLTRNGARNHYAHAKRPSWLPKDLRGRTLNRA